MTPPDRIRVACPGCGARLAVAPSAAGAKVACPKCKMPVAVPPPEDDLGLRIVEEIAPAPSNEPLMPPPAAPSAPFTVRLGSAFLFPVSSVSGVLFLLIMSPIWAFVRFAPIGPFGLLAMVMVAAAVITAIELYLATLQIRVLGLLYLCNKEKLGWFR